MPLSFKKPFTHLALAVIMVFSSFWTGCGKIGDPIPPGTVLPPAVTDLTARVEKREIILRWSLPDRHDRVVSMRILRHEHSTSEGCSACSREYIPLVEAEINDARFQRSDKGIYSYHDREIKSGFFYSYLIVACDNLNYCSDKSNMAETDFQEKD